MPSHAHLCSIRHLLVRNVTRRRLWPEGEQDRRLGSSLYTVTLSLIDTVVYSEHPGCWASLAYLAEFSSQVSSPLWNFPSLSSSNTLYLSLWHLCWVPPTLQTVPGTIHFSVRRPITIICLHFVHYLEFLPKDSISCVYRDSLCKMYSKCLKHAE